MRRSLLSAIGATTLLSLTLPVYASGTAGPDYIAQASAYELGRGVQQNQKRAYRLYCLGAIARQTDAYYHLGWMYFNGRGVPRDHGIAVGWFAKGAEAGDRVAENLLEKLANVEQRPDPKCPSGSLPEPLDRPTIEQLVRLLAPEYGLDPELVLALIKAESAFDPAARSHKGATGLMQLMPATARRFGVRDIHDPIQNLRGGMAYLQWLEDHFDGDLPLILAAYNAGENAVRRYRGIPPYRETRRYVSRITRDYQETHQSPESAARS